MKKTLIGFAGLLLVVGAVLGVGAYGRDGIDSMTAGTGDATILTTATGNYTFAEPWVHRAMVYTHPTLGPSLLYVTFNANTCAPTASGYDYVLEPGDACYLPDGMKCNQITVYNGDAGTITYGTGFVVKGWE